MRAKTFNICGKESLLKAMAEDLKEIGYNILEWNNGKVSNICTNAHEEYNCSSFNNAFKDIYPSSGTVSSKFYKNFNLPEDYVEALSFAKEQFKINEEDTFFKVGNWVIRTVNAGRGMELDKVFKVVTVNKTDVSDSNNLRHSLTSLRLATEKEITNYFIKEADKRGYNVSNLLVKSLVIPNTVAKVNVDKNSLFISETESSYKKDSFYYNGSLIYLNGQWAEIIKSKKEYTFGNTKIKVYNDIVEIGSLSFSIEDIEEFVEYVENPPAIAQLPEIAISFINGANLDVFRQILED